jgi:hypothetical protein
MGEDTQEVAAEAQQLS